MMESGLKGIPEGLWEIGGEECRRRLAVQELILKEMYAWGYEHVQTPAVEPLAAFSGGERDMLRLAGTEGGPLALRSHMAPALARCAARYLKEDSMPRRLCYLERLYKRVPGSQGLLREGTEAGAALAGDGSADGDGEAAALASFCLRAAGLKGFRLLLGHGGFLQSLFKEARLSPETEARLGCLIQNKDACGAEALLREEPVGERQRLLFARMAGPACSVQEIGLFRTLTEHPEALKALSRMEEIASVLDAYGLSGQAAWDLGMEGNDSYTGFFFKVLGQEAGEGIAFGGRCDGILSPFGEKGPVSCFGIDVGRLVEELSRQGVQTPYKRLNTVILYEPEARRAALWLAGDLRRKGLDVQAMARQNDREISVYLSMAKERGLRNLLCLKGDGRIVEAMDLVLGREDLIPLEAYES